MFLVYWTVSTKKKSNFTTCLLSHTSYRNLYEASLYDRIVVIKQTAIIINSDSDEITRMDDHIGKLNKQQTLSRLWMLCSTFRCDVFEMGWEFLLIWFPRVNQTPEDRLSVLYVPRRSLDRIKIPSSGIRFISNFLFIKLYAIEPLSHPPLQVSFDYSRPP